MEQPKKVVICVYRGVADVVYAAAGVNVEIIDLDNEPERKGKVEDWLKRQREEAR